MIKAARGRNQSPQFLVIIERGNANGPHHLTHLQSANTQENELTKIPLYCLHFYVLHAAQHEVSCDSMNDTIVTVPS